MAKRLRPGFLFLFLCASLFGSNQHEHFYSFFLTDAFFDAYRDVLGRSIGDLTLAELTGRAGNTDASRAISEIFGSRVSARLAQAAGVPEKSRELERHLAPKSLAEISTELGALLHAPAERILRQFFEFGPDSRRNVFAYMRNEGFRRRILVSLFETDRSRYEAVVIAASRLTLERTRARDHEVVAFSVPWELFDGHSLGEIGRLFSGQSSRAEFYLSYPRSKMEESEGEYRKKVAALQRGLSEGWAHGVDFTGSIRETTKGEDRELSALYSRRLFEFAELVGRHHGVFKVHAFEAANRGPFYDALWWTLERIAHLSETRRPSRVVMGHIGSLDEADVRRLGDLRKRTGLALAVDANLLSNESIQGKDFAGLLSLVRLLHQQGIEVGLGGDGQGIIGAHDLARIEARFGEHLSGAELSDLWTSVTRASTTHRAAPPPEKRAANCAWARL